LTDLLKKNPELLHQLFNNPETPRKNQSPARGA
jgi:hypothetical protein